MRFAASGTGSTTWASSAWPIPMKRADLPHGGRTVCSIFVVLKFQMDCLPTSDGSIWCPLFLQGWRFSAPPDIMWQPGTSRPAKWCVMTKGSTWWMASPWASTTSRALTVAITRSWQSRTRRAILRYIGWCSGTKTVQGCWRKTRCRKCRGPLVPIRMVLRYPGRIVFCTGSAPICSAPFLIPLMPRPRTVCTCG